MFSEIKFVTVGVRDLDRAIAFYADGFGFEEIARTRVDHEAVSGAWRIPHGIDGRFAVLGIPGIESGMVRLTEWTPSGAHVREPPARVQDLGPHAVNFRVKEIHEAWERLGQSGAREKSRPAYWEVDQNVAAFDSQCYDPDGTLLDVFQIVGEIARTLGPFQDGHDASEVQTLSIHCADARRSAAFYAALGFEPLYDRVIDHVWSFFDLPKGTQIHNINLIMPGARPTGRVELAQYIGLPGRSLKARTAAPGRGPLMMSMQVQGLEQATVRIKALRAKPIGTSRYDCPPFGRVSAATFFGPDDEVIELFEVG